jgi:hypothetical protein
MPRRRAYVPMLPEFDPSLFMFIRLMMSTG